MLVSSARVTAVVLALLYGAEPVQAMSFGIFDARSIAMGGTGVSSGTGGNAVYFNPALLSAANRKEDRFAFEIMISARVADPNKLADDVDRLDSSGKSLSSALDQFNQVPNQANAGQLANAIGTIQGALQTVNNKTLEGNVFASPLTVGVPGRDLGWAIYAGARADLSAQLFFASGDNALLNNYRNAAQQYANTGTFADLAALIAQGDTNGDGKLDDPNYQSHIDVRGAVLGEVGISLAHEFQMASDNLAVGITPKYVTVHTFDYTISPQHADIDVDKGRKDYTSSNLDIGFAKDLGSGFKTGIVGKNVIARTYTTTLGNSIEVRPQWRVGLSHHTPRTTVAIDVDLNENRPVAFDKPTRYAGIGAEINAWDFLQLRAGYRTDLAGNYNAIPSVGLGLSMLGVHLDAAIAGRNKEEVIAAVQLGFRF